MEKSPDLAQQQRTLAYLKPLIVAHRLYLAGGGAVAIHFGHRVSRDIYLFSQQADLDLSTLRDKAMTALAHAKTVGLTDASLRFELAGIPVDIVNYPYPLLEPPVPGPEGVPMAGIRDLATMKLAAVSQRGIRRDFWDLFELLRRGTALGQALDDYALRYGASHSDLYHVQRALTYFEDADRDSVMPSGMRAETHSQTCPAPAEVPVPVPVTGWCTIGGPYVPGAGCAWTDPRPWASPCTELALGNCSRRCSETACQRA